MISVNKFPNATQRDIKRIVSYILNIILAFICILLILQNRRLKSAEGGDSGSILETGTKVESFKYRNLDGEEATFQYAGHDVNQLFFVFTTSCPHCQNSLSEVQQLVDIILARGDVNLLGVSLATREQTLKYIIDNKLRFPIITVDQDFVLKYRTSSIPTLILVGSEGTVKHVWRGELNSNRRIEIINQINESMVAAQEVSK